jgi:glutathione-regulated potassium-efflux system protein KefB
MTAAALLVVLGSALAMQLSGLSMAMGAFLAGVLLSESTFRHQLEADVEPFRGILLGLFFLGVGMSLDLRVITTDWPQIIVAVLGYMALKAAGIYVVARLTSSSHAEALTRAALLAQGGEFAFVLFAAAASVGIFDARTQAVMTATVIISMALTPLLVLSLKWIVPAEEESLDGVDPVDRLSGRVLIVGFGRFGQIASQSLLLRGVDVSIIDNDIEMIKAAATFGFKVYYGDGTRLDILRAAGAGGARAVLICVDKPDVAVRIAELIKAEFPLLTVLARAFDRGTALQLIRAGVDFQLRETFESALVFGGSALESLGVDPEDVAEVIEDVRRRDTARFETQRAEGIRSGQRFLRGNIGTPIPTPLSTPRRPGQALNEETAGVLHKSEPAD